MENNERDLKKSIELTGEDLDYAYNEVVRRRRLAGKTIRSIGKDATIRRLYLYFEENPDATLISAIIDVATANYTGKYSTGNTKLKKVQTKLRGMNDEAIARALRVSLHFEKPKDAEIAAAETIDRIGEVIITNQTILDTPLPDDMQPVIKRIANDTRVPPEIVDNVARFSILEGARTEEDITRDVIYQVEANTRQLGIPPINIQVQQRVVQPAEGTPLPQDAITWGNDLKYVNEAIKKAAIDKLSDLKLVVDNSSEWYRRFKLSSTYGKVRMILRALYVNQDRILAVITAAYSRWGLLSAIAAGSLAYIYGSTENILEKISAIIYTRQLNQTAAIMDSVTPSQPAVKIDVTNMPDRNLIDIQGAYNGSTAARTFDAYNRGTVDIQLRPPLKRIPADTAVEEGVQYPLPLALPPSVEETTEYSPQPVISTPESSPEDEREKKDVTLIPYIALGILIGVALIN